VIETGRLGVAGGMALGLAGSLKVVLLSDLALALAGVAMILGQVLGRMAAVHVAATTIWARSAGMQAHVPSVTSDGYRVALASAVAIMAICAVALGVGTVLCAMLGAIALGQAMRLFMTRWVGGYTSVFLSAARMVAELGVLLGIEIRM
jgi:adenosylcobinamide-GDP ribazoletransferase